MRINVYSQELILTPAVTDAVRMVAKDGTNVEGEKETFYGVRFYLHSPEQLHSTPEDDDRSAITFWLPKSQDNRRLMAALFNEAYHEIITAAHYPED